MKLTDKKIAQFTGVHTNTVTNWKKPLEKEGLKYYLPVGRHRLYQGAKIATYLLSVEEDESKLERVVSVVNNLVYMLTSAKNADDNIKNQMIELAENDAKELQEAILEIDEVSRLKSI